MKLEADFSRFRRNQNVDARRRQNIHLHTGPQIREYLRNCRHGLPRETAPLREYRQKQNDEAVRERKGNSATIDGKESNKEDWIGCQVTQFTPATRQALDNVLHFSDYAKRQSILISSPLEASLVDSVDNYDAGKKYTFGKVHLMCFTQIMLRLGHKNTGDNSLTFSCLFAHLIFVDSTMEQELSSFNLNHMSDIVTTVIQQNQPPDDASISLDDASMVCGNIDTEL